MPDGEAPKGDIVAEHAVQSAGSPLGTSGPQIEAFAFLPNPARASDRMREGILADPGFGSQFTDHMARVSWSKEAGWYGPRVEAFAPLTLHPAAMILHYAEGVFEGLKAFRWSDGTVWTFRPEVNAARFDNSARRLALPQLGPERFMASLRALVEADKAWVPSDGAASLYLRPFMFAVEPCLALHPPKAVEYVLIASVVGDYFKGGIRPVSIWLSEDYTRAAPGGTGAAKCGGNYAAGMVAQEQASEHGCDQVCFLDAAERRWVEELGGMNLFFVFEDGSVVTPELTDTILAGVTRASVIELARDLGHEVVERRVSIDEWRDGVSSGRIVEVFACGTAAVVTPVGQLVDKHSKLMIGDGNTGETAMAIRQRLLDIQFGRVPDQRTWMQRLA
jgi:branched-chain amino acid aminotransferase